METSNRSQTKNYPARCGRKQLHMVSMRISMEQSLKCREVGFEMAIYWYRVAKGHKLRRICSQGSYCIGFYLSGRRRKFGFVHITINTGYALHRHENPRGVLDIPWVGGAARPLILWPCLRQISLIFPTLFKTEFRFFDTLFKTKIDKSIP